MEKKGEGHYKSMLSVLMYKRKMHALHRHGLLKSKDLLTLENAMDALEHNREAVTSEQIHSSIYLPKSKITNSQR